MLRTASNTPRVTAQRVLALAALGAIVAVVPVLGLAAPAQAHNYLVSSTPAAGETLTELPEEFSITTNEALLDLGGEGAGFALEVIDADGLYYGDGCTTVAGDTMSVPAAIGAAGDYSVIWQVVTADGHTVSDEFTFTWAPTGASVASEGSTEPQRCDTAGEGTTTDDPAVEPTEGSTEPGAATGDTDGDSTTAPAVNVGDVLWIGGTVVVVGLAIGITLLVTGRKKKK